MKERVKQLMGVALGIALVAYPVAVYFGLRGGSPRTAALTLLAVFVPAAALRASRADGQRVRTLAMLPMITVSLLVAAALLDASGFILAVPAVVNAILLASFGATLRFGPPMIERFARLVEPELSGEKVRWCRLWTVVWCVFFALNGAAAAALAAFAPLEVWAAYTGLVAYGLMGLLFSLEWTLRRLRFGPTAAEAHR